MRNIFKVIGYGIIGALLLDAIGFIAWVASGQTPSDNFYIGTITAHVVAWVIK